MPATASHVAAAVPDGTPEQVTFGVTEEEGPVRSGRRSFVTSIGNS